ncbi:uncharacterized protein LOC119719715 [Patiria miniata]|uniref:SWIM-type domain-containing protein n=1 Tax=Patiria miniata TaxID=46514 RepID=A0A913Z2B5_PATMI|nr:uncharacterized protein LOC119719715 [Patiria miniata]
MKSFKSLDSYSYFVNGFVQAILYSSVSADSPVCVLRSRVTHSQSLTKPPVSTWIMINKSTGSVVAAHCMCMAGLGEACSHIAAVMFKLEAANRLGYTSQACTEKACSWNKDCMNGRDLDPCTLKDLSFTKPKHQSSQGRQENRSVRPLNRTSTATLGDLDLDAFKRCLELEGHQNVTLWDVGLYIDPDSPFLGASPDAMVSCTCCGVQCVEVKCPHNNKKCTQPRSTKFCWSQSH